MKRHHIHHDKDETITMKSKDGVITDRHYKISSYFDQYTKKNITKYYYTHPETTVTDEVSRRNNINKNKNK